MKLPSLEDYEIAIDTQQLIKAKELKGGEDPISRMVSWFAMLEVFVSFSHIIPQ